MHDVDLMHQKKAQLYAENYFMRIASSHELLRRDMHIRSVPLVAELILMIIYPTLEKIKYEEKWLKCASINFRLEQGNTQSKLYG